MSTIELPSTSGDHVRATTYVLAQKYLELLQKQDWDAWIQLWSDDAILEFPYAPAGAPNRYEGKANILRYMSATTEGIAVDGVTSLAIHPQLDPTAVVVELHITGHLLKNGATYEQKYVTFFQFENERILRYREYWNPLISIEAFGGYKKWREGARQWHGSAEGTPTPNPSDE
jgi:uncharacterized protein